MGLPHAQHSILLGSLTDQRDLPKDKAKERRKVRYKGYYIERGKMN